VRLKLTSNPGDDARSISPSQKTSREKETKTFQAAPFDNLKGSAAGNVFSDSLALATADRVPLQPDRFRDRSSRNYFAHYTSLASIPSLRSIEIVHI
jgi:hypothetical protein